MINNKKNNIIFIVRKLNIKNFYTIWVNLVHIITLNTKAYNIYRRKGIFETFFMHCARI